MVSERCVSFAGSKIKDLQCCLLEIDWGLAIDFQGPKSGDISIEKCHRNYKIYSIDETQI